MRDTRRRKLEAFLALVEDNSRYNGKVDALWQKVYEFKF
jgi:hypothetical protein